MHELHFTYTLFTPQRQEMCAKYMQLLSPFAISVESIGSTGAKLNGKNEIDLLLISENVEITMEQCVTHGFKKGPINDGEGFLRKQDNGTIIELHVVEKSSKKINNYREIVALLLQPQNANKYDELKKKLHLKPISEYKSAKNKFYKELLVKR